MEKMDYEKIVDKVLSRMKRKIRVEASGRHVHLSESDAISLFGKTDLTIRKELSQPGQYVYQERVELVGPKGMIRDVAILGPCRGKTQVELSVTDMRALGLEPVFKNSGDLEGAGDLLVTSGTRAVSAISAAIVAKRHLHLTPEDAAMLCVREGQYVAVRVFGMRTVIFEDVLVRVNARFSLSLHIDYDEANAVGLTNESYGELVWI